MDFQAHIVELGNKVQGDIMLRDGMLDPSKKWNSENDILYSLVQTCAGLLDQNIRILEAI